MTNLNKKILYKNSEGEYFPYDKSDALLVVWCKLYNKKLSKGKIKRYNKGCPIQTNLLYYCTPYPFDSILFEWCKLKNKELKEHHKAKSHTKEMG